MIIADGLTKYYGDKCAIADLSFEIKQGEIVGILGLNGAGKTTTLRILSCLLLPSAGRVKINGLDIYESPHEIRRQVGFLPEDPPLYREMTVEAYLTFAAELRGLSRSTARAGATRVMEMTHTIDVRHELIANLSHGYRKRVGIGQAIVHQPAVLILDEPISGLDPVQIVEMRETILKLKGSHTILVSSHILPEISQTCDRILVVQNGRMVATGTEAELTGQLSGAHRLQLTVRGEKEEVLTRIRAVAGVTEVQPSVAAEPRAKEAEGKPVHSYRVEAQGDVREALSRELVQAGFGLLKLGPAEAELESVFIQLTQRKEVSR